MHVLANYLAIWIIVYTVLKSQQISKMENHYMDDVGHKMSFSRAEQVMSLWISETATSLGQYLQQHLGSHTIKRFISSGAQHKAYWRHFQQRFLVIETTQVHIYLSLRSLYCFAILYPIYIYNWSTVQYVSGLNFITLLYDVSWR